MTTKKTGTKEWSDISQNLFIGCRNNCRYGYGREMMVRLKRKTPENWPDMIPAKRWRTTKPKLFKNQVIMFPSLHDIFPEHLDETVEFLTSWLKLGNKYLIVSKPRLECIKRLCEDLEQYREQIKFRFTIGSYHDDVLGFWEPNAPKFTERKECLAFAYNAGYKTSCSCEPYLDEDVLYLIQSHLLTYVTDTVWIGKMNKIDDRVDTKGWTTVEKRYLKRVKEAQTDEFIKDLYQKLKGIEEIRWKDSCKEVLDLPEEDIG